MTERREAESLIGSLLAGWLLATTLKPSRAQAAVETPPQASKRYQFISKGGPGMGLYVFEPATGKVYRFAMDSNGTPDWKKMGSPEDAK